MSTSHDDDPQKSPQGRSPRPAGSPDPRDRYGATYADGGVPAEPPKSATAGADTYGATYADGGVAGGSSSTGDSVGQSSMGLAAADLYEVVYLIGEGGMGTVSLARDRRLRTRWLALKRLGPQFINDERLIQRFRIEAESVASLSHYHIVQVFTMNEDFEGPYIAMEYVPGPPRPHSRPGWPANAPNPPLDMEEKVKEDGALSVAEVLRFSIKLCSAVAYAHKRGVIHRDIKPANILINDENDPKLADFGLARQVDARAASMTLAGSQLLTLGYGAPEQEIDASRVDARADIYSLGATMWYMLTGENPRHFRESQVPEALRFILVKALEKDREKRYQTAKELEEALQRLDPHSRMGTGAGQPPPGAPVPGRCPECGHQHSLEANGGTSRKFCEACGCALFEKCLSCGSENGVWARFCGVCRADLVAFGAAEKEKLEQTRRTIEKLRREKNFTGAFAKLRELMAIEHPRLFEFNRWASDTMPQVEIEESQDRQERVQRLREAGAYSEAIDLLKRMVPETRSRPHLAEFHGWAADTVLDLEVEQACSQQTEVQRLRQEGDFPKAITILEEMTSNPSPPRHLADLCNWAKQTLATVKQELTQAEADRDRKVEEARALGAAGAFPKGIALLDTFPPSMRTERFREVFSTLHENQNTVTVLRADIRRHLAAKQFSGEPLRALHECVKHLVQLQPKDNQILALLNQVEQRQRQEEEKIWASAYQQGTLEGFRSYVARYPQGEHASVAKALIAPQLRDALLDDLRNEALRNEYLSLRTPEMEQEDLTNARFASLCIGAFYGAIGGGILGVAIGAVTGAIGGIIGGVIGGLVAPLIGEQE